MNKSYQKLTFKTAKEFKAFLETVKIMPRTTNRDISTSHVNEMKLAICTQGVLRPIIVVKTDAFGEGMQYYITDGQHLRVAILSTPDKELKGFFDVNVISEDNAEEIVLSVATLNTTAKTWQLKDHFASMLGLMQLNPKKYEDYGLLNNKVTETKYELVGLIEAYGVSNDLKHIDFKRGKFQFNERQGNKIVSFYEEALKSGLFKCPASFRAIVRFIRANPNTNLEKILKQITLNPYFSQRCNRDRYMSLLSSLRVKN